MLYVVLVYQKNENVKNSGWIIWYTTKSLIVRRKKIKGDDDNNDDDDHNDDNDGKVSLYLY